MLSQRISPSRHITAAYGYSPASTALIASAMQRSIIARSKTSAVDLLDIICGRDRLEDYLREGRCIVRRAQNAFGGIFNR
jgi:hypothetical protein